MVSTEVTIVLAVVGTVVVAALIYYLIQFVDDDVYLVKTLEAEPDKVKTFWSEITNFHKLHPYLKSTDKLDESEAEGVTHATYLFKERPAGAPVDISYITIRKTWSDEDKLYIQHISNLLGKLVNFDITTVISRAGSSSTKVEELCKINVMRLLKPYVLSQFTPAQEAILARAKDILEK